MSVAGIVTVNDVAESKIVLRRVVPTKADEFPANPEPMSCMSSEVVRTTAVGGTRLVSTGADPVTVNSAPSTLLESGGGFSTPIRNSPDLLKNSAGIVALNRVFETKVVMSGVLAKRIRDPARKFVPVTVIPSAAEPAAAKFGVKLAIVGGSDTTLTMKVAEPPPGEGFTIEPLRIPGSAICDAGTEN
jgi:hypothetical protein